MTIAPGDAQRDALPYLAMRDIVEQMQPAVPGKLEITKEGIVHDMTSPGGPHELTAARVSRRLEKVMPEGLLAHTGTPDVEDVHEGVMRHPDVMVIAEADMEVEGSFDPTTLLAAIEVVSRSNPDNDWVGKMRDYPLLGIPVYVLFDPRTGEGAVLSDIHPTPNGPRYATRTDFVYGEDVTIGAWTISTAGLPRYR
ncbi:Uma2 family endonuclease [Streptomyces cocklensis]|jgi:Uma2 family endonuclease|uniref:Uma2 family endonuclease n=1 Tax=Actinacidiphila cocklensis TaxID=887465 RepID=A0A9W4GNL5_9ACTN|nr:Uma2 family endonuclease [Actinacidiphila cocklensis]MDD1061029.1 Uma2 family endonuclease [Actinacidiphila cocklensis]WSX77352.1 Uma2 family endonuclease [Streptomyces sp. NBC_00899]CAG6391468.1 Uma2 family endonuclease [Actinacidiphila cocklensis]